jgi:hypothetical protein
MLRLPSTRTHLPLMASCSTVVCGLHMVPNDMDGGMTQDTTATSDTAYDQNPREDRRVVRTSSVMREERVPHVQRQCRSVDGCCLRCGDVPPIDSRGHGSGSSRGDWHLNGTGRSDERPCLPAYALDVVGAGNGLVKDEEDAEKEAERGDSSERDYDGP